MFLTKSKHFLSLHPTLSSIHLSCQVLSTIFVYSFHAYNILVILRKKGFTSVFSEDIMSR